MDMEEWLLPHPIPTNKSKPTPTCFLQKSFSINPNNRRREAHQGSLQLMDFPSLPQNFLNLMEIVIQKSSLRILVGGPKALEKRIDQKI
ncbi:hypothetical protein H5410_041413 [Solanum commersonii]|uniref:Uncharacterized protein n=1 Tax=Solanum commersonii TaxID=4109 RepID=A0A9J5XRH6_SOLCO|nr:hypothetical protein H5410_041413 [Solanum commersonii]